MTPNNNNYFVIIIRIFSANDSFKKIKILLTSYFRLTLIFHKNL